MHAILRHLLLLTIGGLLTLPPGWCCLLPVACSAGPAKAARPRAEIDCPSCRPPAPAEEGEEPQAPSGPDCCCGPQDRLASGRIDLPDVDLSLPLVPALEVTSTPAAPPPAVEAPPPTRALHLLRCVWLC